jgi:D-alanyl-D-alanine dipeptidase
MDTGDILASVKKGFVEFIDFITLGAFGKDSIGKLFDDVINFLAPIAETVGNFIDGIGNFFNDKFQKLKKFFGISREKTPAESEPIQVKTPIELLNEQIATLKAKRDSLVTLNEAKKAKVEELRAQKRKKQEEKIAELKAIPGKIKDKIFEVGKKVVSKVSATVSPTASTPAAPVSPVASSPAPEPITGGAKEEPGQQGGGSLAQLVKVDTGVDISKFNPALEEAVVRMADAFKKETGKRLLITSGYRSNEKQKQLWDAELAKNGGDAAKARKMVAPPAPPLGTGKGSPHLRGLAIDINSRGADGINALAGTRENPTGWLEKFGLARPVPNENWHVQLAKTPPVGDSNTAVNDNGKVVNLATGKQEVGEKVAKNSVELAQNQREQEKRQTPTVINAGITNNNTNVRNTSRAEAKAA